MGAKGRREPDVKGPEDKADSMVVCLSSFMVGRLVGCLQYGTSGSRVVVGWLTGRPVSPWVDYK